MAHALLTTPPMRLALSIAMAVASGAALGQTSGLTLQIQSTDRLVVGPSQCGANVPVNWAVTSVSQVCTSLRIWVTQGTSCATAPSGSDFSLPDVTVTEMQAGQGTVTLALADLPGLTAADGGAGCGAAVRQEYRVCGTFKIAGGYPASCGASQTDVSASSAPALIYDGEPPPPPTLTALVPLDSSLVAKVTANSTDTITIILQVKEPSDPTSVYTTRDTFSADSGSGTITGLQNGATYSVIAIAEDEAGNQSGPSAPLTGSPVPTSGFFGQYTQDGGAEKGGCSIAGGALLWPAALALAFAGWFAISRRRRS